LWSGKGIGEGVGLERREGIKIHLREKGRVKRGRFGDEVRFVLDQHA
jgi:hypothetical protein